MNVYETCLKTLSLCWLARLHAPQIKRNRSAKDKLDHKEAQYQQLSAKLSHHQSTSKHGEGELEDWQCLIALDRFWVMVDQCVDQCFDQCFMACVTSGKQWNQIAHRNLSQWLAINVIRPGWLRHLEGTKNMKRCSAAFFVLDDQNSYYCYSNVIHICFYCVNWVHLTLCPW